MCHRNKIHAGFRDLVKKKCIYMRNISIIFTLITCWNYSIFTIVYCLKYTKLTSPVSTFYNVAAASELCMWLTVVAHIMVLLGSAARGYNSSGFSSGIPHLDCEEETLLLSIMALQALGCPGQLSPTCSAKREWREKNWWACNLQVGY